MSLVRTGLLAMAALGLLGGCSIGYLAHTTNGHLQLLGQARPVSSWLDDAHTPQRLREQLLSAQQLREFAVRELALPDGASYRRFAQLQRPAAVWNVVATPALSLALERWCFPVAGCVSYRGYFDPALAHGLAQQLQQRGLEVWVYPVPAYSTLGRTDWLGGDPLLDTFIAWPQVDLARLLFHEMAHQVVYVDGDTAFNESYATAVERLGLQRWLRDAPEAQRQQVARRAQRQQDFQRITAQARQQLQAVYSGAATPADPQREKARVMAELRAAHQALKAGPWGGDPAYDAWFERVNNAALAIQGAYLDLVPAFERLFKREGEDFARFHRAVRDLAALPPAKRQERLRALMETPG